MKLFKHNAFTITEMLIGLVIVGALAAFIIPAVTSSGSKNTTQISESIKSDINKAFQLTKSTSGLIQKSVSPKDIVKNALNLSNGIDDPGNSANFQYTTQQGWHVSVPKAWPDNNKAVITITTNDGKPASSIEISRDALTRTSTELATYTPVTLSEDTLTEATTSSPTTNAHITTGYHFEPPKIKVNISFNFTGMQSGETIDRYNIVISNCSATPQSLTELTGNKISLDSSTSCTATVTNLHGGTHDYTASAFNFTSGYVSSTINIPVTQVRNHVPIQFTFTGMASGENISQYSLSLTGSDCAATPASITNPQALSASISENANCTVTASGLHGGTHDYTSSPVNFNSGTGKTVNIPVTQIVPPTPINVTFRFTNSGTVVNTYASTRTGSIRCNGTADNPLGSALRISLPKNSTCYATFDNLSAYDSVNKDTRVYNQVTKPQMFRTGTINKTVSIIVQGVPKTYTSGFIDSLLSVGNGGSSGSYKSLLSWHSYYQSNVDTSFRTLLGSNYDTFMNSSNPVDDNTVSLVNSTGATQLIPWADFQNNLTVNGQSWVSWVHDTMRTTYGNLVNSDYVGKVVADAYAGKIDTYSQGVYFEGAVYGAGVGAVGGVNLSSDRTSLADLQIKYVDPVTHDTYNVNAFYFSPIKINLKPKDAVVTDNGSFKFDVDGFKSRLTPVMETTGGLNIDEAWLALDRGEHGFIKNTIMDGDDLFGDHLGLFPSGYEDLAKAYSDQIQTDRNGTRYIALTPISWWDDLVRNVQKFFGFKVKPCPYSDLKLITADNQIINANTVINRIDVSYKKVLEVSTKRSTAIFQRSNVYYLNGAVAKSADIWFKPKLFLTKETK